MATGFTYRHYILKDHLGSWTTITDAEGNVEQELSFDAWGTLRDPETWMNYLEGDGHEMPMFDRGYTGHEHLYSFGLINMNGRMYDPVMSSFLSVDAYVQSPDNSQNFNRYAYCAYNPLRYTDPTGWEMGSGNGNLPDDYPPIPDGTYVLPEVPIIADGVNSSSGGYNPQGIGIEGLQIVLSGEISAGNVYNLVIGGLGFIPYVGWAIDGVAIVADVVSYAFTGQTIGEHIDNACGNWKHKFWDGVY